MKRVRKLQAVVVDRAAEAEAAAVAVLIATGIAIAIAAVAAAVAAEIPARAAGSQPRIIATVPDNRANLAGNSQHAPSQSWAVHTRFHTRRLVWLRRNPRFKNVKKR
jgi:hypothetical protein